MVDLDVVRYDGGGWSPLKQQIIRNAPIGGVLVDVGCKEGWWLRGAGITPGRDIRVFGFDPIDYGVASMYESYSACAVGLEDGVSSILYTMNEPGCNSLLAPSRDLIGSEIGKSGSFREMLEPIEVLQRRLDSLFDEFNIHDVYYLKTDCQGTDIGVIESSGVYMGNIAYVEMEVGLCESRSFYDGAPTVEDVVSRMDEFGFDLIEFSEFPHSPLPEGEVVFRSKMYEV